MNGKHGGDPPLRRHLCAKVEKSLLRFCLGWQSSILHLRGIASKAASIGILMAIHPD
jgi:hypothetical protein